MKARWATTAAVVAAASLTVAACGSSIEVEAVDEVVTETSADATAAAPTTAAAPATTAVVAAELPTDPLELLTYAFESSAGRSVRGEMLSDFGGFAAITLSFEVDPDANMAMTMSVDDPAAGGLAFEILMVEGATYVRFAVPEELQGLAFGAPPDGWFTLDAEAAASMGILCPSPLPGDAPRAGGCPAPNDNAHLIEFVTDAETFGSEQIDGEPMTHIRYTLDAAALAASQGAESQGTGPDGGDGSALFPAEMFGDGLATDVWIDGEGLTRRVSLDLGSMFGDLAEDFGADAEDVPGFAIMIDFFDYDADITITAPPSDEIVGDFSDVMGSGPGEGPGFDQGSGTAPDYDDS
ncbi:hypothetical protein [Candidatus Poriferisodalis sp.]|uniref:hypothetical protein n=1 Tax=Candidatus Poriferisodalis sp. TaxID=3101277 RepID=UPI003B51561B